MRWLIFLVFLFNPIISRGQTSINDPVDNDRLIKLFYNLLSVQPDSYNQSLEEIEKNWEESFTAPMIEMLILVDHQKVRKRVVSILEQNTGQKLGSNAYDWWQWLWSQPPTFAPFYADLKSRIYKNIDHKFASYFTNRHDLSRIRLDEILWGGVRQDGIPPLRDPEMLTADKAKYLFKEDIIFGINIDGDARAYPRRILGWHEMVVDNISDKRIAGVYCTLCGTMIAYDMTFNGKYHDLGTSGFLYRSNKLMYDKGTQSLWNTIEGRPVVGPLINEHINLHTYPVVTTTWSEWRKAHPDTKVLSIRTGYERNYNPGAAYRSYYATDDLMFPVPLKDTRLNNKEEVLVIRSEGYEDDPLAISNAFLKTKTVYHDKINGRNIVVVTEKKGGSRVYASADIRFESYKNGILRDQEGSVWNLTDETLSDSDSITLSRLPSHNIFWFAWYNAFPDTRLVR